MQPDKVVSTLNHLIEINRGALRGYQEAAEKIGTPEIKTFCFEQIRVRWQFVDDLLAPLLSLGGHPKEKGSVVAAVHRGWIDLKAALGGGDHAILGAIETGEDYVVKEYKKAQGEKLPERVRDIVERQFQSVKQAHVKVKGMRERLDK